MELIVVLIVILAVVFINVVNKSKGNNNSAGIAKETKEMQATSMPAAGWAAAAVHPSCPGGER